MASFRADKLVFGVGFAGTLLLFAATLHSVVKEEDKEVHCWAPAHFEHSHVQYTNHICEYEEHRHPHHHQHRSLNYSDSQPAEGASRQRNISACSLAYYGIQAVLLFISYYLLSSITSTLSPTSRTKSVESISKESLLPQVHYLERASCSVMVSYLFTQLLSSVILIGLGMRSLAEFPSIHQAPNANHTFLCDFTIRRLGNIQRYTVECVEDEEEFGGSIALLTKGAPLMNTMLCVVLVLMIAIHVVTMLCCGSRARGLSVGGSGGKQAVEYEVSNPNACISDATLEAALARENSN